MAILMPHITELSCLLRFAKQKWETNKNETILTDEEYDTISIELDEWVDKIIKSLMVEKH